MGQAALKVNMESEDLETEARFFRHNLNSQLKDVRLRFERIKDLSEQALKKIDENEWNCWHSVIDLNNKIFEANQAALMALYHLDEYVDDYDREIIRRSHKYSFGYCQRHEESFKRLWEDREYECESCYEEKLQHNEFIGMAKEDRD